MKERHQHNAVRTVEACPCGRRSLARLGIPSVQRDLAALLRRRFRQTLPREELRNAEPAVRRVYGRKQNRLIARLPRRRRVEHLPVRQVLRSARGQEGATKCSGKGQE